jgi:hypothetical protein
VDRAADVAAPALELAGELAQVASARLEALERGGEVVAPALEALAAAVDEQAQVVAGVAVQAGEDLLELDVGQRVLHGDGEALGHRAAGAAGRQLDDHVLEPGLGPQEHRRVAADALGPAAADLHGHDRAALDELDLLDLAHVDAGDGHGLALARRDRLGGLELALELEEVRAQHRHARGQVEALVGQDVAAHDGGDEDQHDERREVADVLADHALHLSAPSSDAVSSSRRARG